MVNKYISETGACSRREADRLVGEGRVTVNGQRARMGSEVGEGDEVRLDGQVLRPRSAAKGQRRHVYIALNKPVGITCTTESASRATSSTSSATSSASSPSAAWTRIPRA
jgi:23S rRNA pseudouridine2604 synthase